MSASGHDEHDPVDAVWDDIHRTSSAAPLPPGPGAGHAVLTASLCRRAFAVPCAGMATLRRFLLCCCSARVGKR
jgi:hypothetical protein